MFFGRVRFGALLQQPQCRFSAFGAFGQVAQGAFGGLPGMTLIGERSLRIALRLLRGIDLFLHRSLLLFETFGEFPQLGGSFAFPAGNIHRFCAGEFRVSDFGLQRGDLRLSIVQGPFGPFTGRCFSGKRRFGALQAARLRGAGGVGGRIAADDCYRDFPVLDETPAVQPLTAPLGSKTVHHASRLFGTVIVHTRAHPAIQSQRPSHLCFDIR